MASLGIQHLTSSLSTCSSLRPRLSASSSRRRTVQCVCLRREEGPVERLPSIASRLVATGLALAVSTSSFVAVASDTPLVSVSNVAQKADELLKDADKLTNEESPPRFGPSRGGVSGDDAGRVAQKGGSGAIPEIQNPGSEIVGQARDTISDKVASSKQKLDESLGKAQDKAGEAKRNVQGFFGQAQEKAKSDVERVKDGSDDKVKGLVGDATNKVKGDVDTTRDNEGLIGSIKKGLNIQ